MLVGRPAFFYPCASKVGTWDYSSVGNWAGLLSADAAAVDRPISVFPDRRPAANLSELPVSDLFPVRISLAA